MIKMDNTEAIKTIEEHKKKENYTDYFPIGKSFTLAMESLEKQVPFKLISQDEDTGICKCGRVTEIIDGEYYCKYCGQKVTA